MELHERIAVVRKAAGLTQEQLGELIGVTRQAVSKWESGQTVPDALTVAKLCEELHTSADYVLLGKESDEQIASGNAPAYEMPTVCPCCGRAAPGTLCLTCGYPLPSHPPRGGRYALVACRNIFDKKAERIAELEKYCGLSREKAEMIVKRLEAYGIRVLLQRDLTDDAARWIAGHLTRYAYDLRIVEDLGESEDALLDKPAAMELPFVEKQTGGIGFWGVVGAVIVALLILSFF